MTREELEAGYKRLEQEVLLLRQQLEYFKRREFGRKSERFEPLDHPELFDPEAAGKTPSSDDVAAPEDKAPAAEKDKEPKRQRRTRTERIPKDLPVVEIEAEPPAEVLRNPSAWRKTSCETHDQLEKEPGYFYVLRTVSWRYVPVDQPFAVPIMAPAKPRIILNGFFGPGLVAELLTDKYLYHLPFYRQHQLILRRYGVDIPESTMYDAAAKVGDQLGILICRMKDRMLADGVVACDETPVRCLDRTAPGGSRQGYFWVYRGLSGDVIFDWQTSREHRHFAEWMGNDYEGTLLCDAYQAYINYCELQARRGRKVRRAACLAHIRRKFEAA